MTAARPDRPLPRWPPWAGAAVWAAALLVLRPTPLETAWARALLLLAALVLVPLALRLLDARQPPGGPRTRLRWAAAAQLPAALLLGGAQLLPPGWRAAALALPWLAVTALLAAAGLERLLDAQRRRSRRPLAELCLDAGLLYILVGGLWAVADRLGLQPLGFEPVIVLLTAIHFHYAGFALPLLVGFALREVDGPLARLAGIGVIAGVPLVAAGITASQLGANPWLECTAAQLTAAAGLATSWLHLRLAGRRHHPLAARALWTLAAITLAAGMLLAALYGARAYLPVAWLDIPWMRALHGTANGLGFGLAGLAGWAAASSPEKAPGISAL